MANVWRIVDSRPTDVPGDNVRTFGDNWHFTFGQRIVRHDSRAVRRNISRPGTKIARHDEYILTKK